MEAHENHNEPTRFNNDVAIITVTEPFDFTDPNVQPIEWFKKEDGEIPGKKHFLAVHLVYRKKRCSH